MTATTDFYGAGTHTWPYWQADLRNFLAFLQNAWASPLPAPPAVPFTYRSTALGFAVWGWSVSVADRNLPAFTTLSNVTSSGLVIRGGGTVTATTPGQYPAGSRWTVSRGDGQTDTVTADGQGRLTFTVALGPISPASYAVAIAAPLPVRPGDRAGTAHHRTRRWLTAGDAPARRRPGGPGRRANRPSSSAEHRCRPGMSAQIPAPPAISVSEPIS